MWQWSCAARWCHLFFFFKGRDLQPSHRIRGTPSRTQKKSGQNAKPTVKDVIKLFVWETSTPVIPVNRSFQIELVHWQDGLLWRASCRRGSTGGPGRSTGEDMTCNEWACQGASLLWRWQSAWHDQSRVMRLHSEHHVLRDHKTPPRKVGLNQPRQLWVYRQTVKKRRWMKRNQLVLRKVLRVFRTWFHLDGLHFPWSSMGAVFSAATEVWVWKRSPASHTRRSDKSCLVTLDL